MDKHQAGVAAKAYSAAVFAQYGLNVFVQYGANQPGYDLLVSSKSRSQKVSVKGSTNECWLLTTKQKDHPYEDALDKWTEKNKGYLFSFVQFHGVNPGEMPRIYLVMGSDVSTFLREGYFGEISLSLWEHLLPKKGKYAGKVQTLPSEWNLSETRIKQLF